MPNRLSSHLPILLILLLAFGLRLYGLTDVPPGLTHDEANHGREAIGVLDGDLRFYFPLNYGSEPVYSYTVAGSMSLLGENLFALRLVNVLFGVAAIGITYAWAVRAAGSRVALLAAALLAFSFWPLASSREALRAGMLPFFTTGAVWFFWQMVERPAANGRLPLGAVAGFTLSLAVTMHIYLAARVAWLMFPLFLGYLALAARPLFRRIWQPLLLGLAGTGILVIPMFLYLRLNPWAQTRLSMLDGPLQQITSGQFWPVLRNVARALLAFVWPGYGDQFLAYNIPGRPVFDGVTAVFFAAGLAVTIAALIRSLRPGIRAAEPELFRIFVLIWFFTGILPSLITGPTANTTRNLAALPAVHLLPAIGFVAAADWLAARWQKGASLLPAAAALWLLLAGGVTVRDYFMRWGQDPDVRGAYQVTQIAMFDYLVAQETAAAVTISTVYPGPAHDPSLALVLRPQLRLRWTDARHALIWPRGQTTHAIIPASTPPHPAFAAWLTPLESVTMPAGDLDPHFTYYQLEAPPPARGDEALANFGDGVRLLRAQWLAPRGRPGETAELLTVWQVIDPARVGPVVQPIAATDVVLFTQVLHEGSVLAQRDALDAPSWDWQAGDVIMQVHSIPLPPETEPGIYEAIVGIYDRRSGDRLIAVGEAGGQQANYAPVPPLHVIKP